MGELYVLILTMYILTGVFSVICLIIYLNFKKEILKFKDKWLRGLYDLIYINVEKLDKWIDKSIES